MKRSKRKQLRASRKAYNKVGRRINKTFPGFRGSYWPR